MGILKNKKLTSSAEVVNDHLVLSLPNAEEPVVWRMALKDMGTASFEIKPVKNSNVHKLVLKPKKGTAEIIAPFQDKDTALEALIKASDALQSGGTSKKNNGAANETENVTATPQQKTRSGSNKWLYLLLGLGIVIGLYAFLSNQAPNRIGTLTATQNTADTNVNSEVGIPLSADDYFKDFN